MEDGQHTTIMILQLKVHTGRTPTSAQWLFQLSQVTAPQIKKHEQGVLKNN